MISDWIGFSTAALGASGLVACAGAPARLKPFSTDWEDDRGVSIAREWQHLVEGLASPAADVVVGVAARATDKVVGRPLDGGPVWTVHHPLDVRPVVAGSMVVVSGGGDVLAVDARTGAAVWHQASGALPLLGAGDDGSVTVLTFLQSGGRGSVILAVGRDGQVVRRIETSRAVGAPAAVRGVAFVPWDGQYVSAINVSTGDEEARVTFREVTSRAWVEGGSLWFGETTFTRFDQRIRDASRGAASVVRVPVHLLPGIPRLMAPGGSPLAPESTAEDKTRVYARPAASGGDVGVADHHYYATYFRLALGFGTPSGALAWVHRHPSDLVGGAAAVGGVVLCDEHGNVTELDAKTGGVVKEFDLGEPVKACVVGVDEFAVAGPPAATKPFAEQLADAVLAEDPQLVVLQKILLGELAAVEDPAATRTLVALADDPRTSPDLVVVARKALAGRRNGAEFMLRALEHHADFLKDVAHTPAVGPMAQALGAMRARAAAPLLAAHLLDPADTDDDVRQAAAALSVLATPNELPQLRQFFGMYRASSAGNDDLSDALVSVARAMLEVGDRTAREQLEAAAADPATVPYVAERLRPLLGVEPIAAPPLDAGATAMPPNR
jgi:outer membrane protein assembly factor BamB